MSATQPPPILTIGAQLERDRLERRATRVALAVAALRQRASEQPSEAGTPPRHLANVIADFEAQIEAMNARLRELA
jgi:hypothetical protein